jgi:E1A-binding protein p400
VNAFHVCITSYKLVIRDHQSFRRKKWKYLILDEAQNIKNFKSQRWQLLLNFSTERRLLLTGTPLQNHMMELWSLMHFLMPNFFESHRTFEELFSKPMSGMVEGNIEYNETIIIKLHKVLRPFLLRRLKCEVEKQMPKKYEHVVMCRLSKRQRFLYDDFMSRAKTKETLASGNLLSVINVLMQLRKVCNHPNLFEVRPTTSPFRMEQIDMTVPSMVYNIVQYDPLRDVDLVALNLVLIHLETCLSAFVAYRTKQLITPKKLIEEIDSVPELPPICPRGKCKIHMKIKPYVQRDLSSSSQIKVGTSPAFRADGSRISNDRNKPNAGGVQPMEIDEIPTIRPVKPATTTGIYHTPTGQIYLFNTKQKSGVMLLQNQNQQQQPTSSSINQPIASAVIDAVRSNSTENIIPEEKVEPAMESEFHLPDLERLQHDYRRHILQLMSKSNQRKCDANPLYGEDLRNFVWRMATNPSLIHNSQVPFLSRSSLQCRFANWSLEETIKSIEERASELKEIFENFVFVVPAVSAPVPSLSVTHMHPSMRNSERRRVEVISRELASKTTLVHSITSAMATQVSFLTFTNYCKRLKSVRTGK